MKKSSSNKHVAYIWHRHGLEKVYLEDARKHKCTTVPNTFLGRLKKLLGKLCEKE